jgi:sec-independent protein translocase protein TatA
MNVFGIGLPEMVLILVVALLVFGPKKLPEIGRSMGKALKGFQDASKEFENEFKRQADMVENSTSMEATLETPEPPKQLHQSADTTANITEPVEVAPAEMTETNPAAETAANPAAESGAPETTAG